jgi:hypothetical protein
METALAFPEPLPEDPEVVATALETAGIFGVQGDVREAVRWVRRAAELAGDAGIDDRAFALARAAADLTSNFSARVESAPPPAAPAQGAAPNGATAPIASAPPPPPPPPVVAQSRPSPAQDSRPPHQAVSVSPILSLGVKAVVAPAAEDEGEITSQHPPHRARSTDSAPPVQTQATAQAAPASPAPAAGKDTLAALFEETPVARAGAAPAPTGGRPLTHTIAYQSPPESPPVAKLEEPATPPPPEQTVRYPSDPARPNFAEPPRHAQSSQHLVATQVYEPVQPEATFVEEAVPVMEATVNAAEPSAPIAAAPQSASARQAARASIEQSQEEGVYILRLLKNGEAAAFGTFEALVVLVDPGAELFTGA